jgi:hypothetical protein
MILYSISKYDIIAAVCNNQPTVWDGAFSQRLVVAQLVKKFLVFMKS